LKGAFSTFIGSSRYNLSAALANSSNVAKYGIWQCLEQFIHKHMGKCVQKVNLCTFTRETNSAARQQTSLGFMRNRKRIFSRNIFHYIYRVLFKKKNGINCIFLLCSINEIKELNESTFPQCICLVNMASSQ
jgi:hypothetical protein